MVMTKLEYRYNQTQTRQDTQNETFEVGGQVNGYELGYGITYYFSADMN